MARRKDNQEQPYVFDPNAPVEAPPSANRVDEADVNAGTPATAASLRHGKDEQGVRSSYGDQVVTAKVDQHVLDPNAVDAVQIPDTFLNRPNALSILREPTPEEQFSGTANPSDDGKNSSE